jgi:hypothetical protein
MRGQSFGTRDDAFPWRVLSRHSFAPILTLKLLNLVDAPHPAPPPDNVLHENSKLSRKMSVLAPLAAFSPTPPAITVTLRVVPYSFGGELMYPKFVTGNRKQNI